MHETWINCKDVTVLRHWNDGNRMGVTIPQIGSLRLVKWCKARRIPSKAAPQKPWFSKTIPKHSPFLWHWVAHITAFHGDFDRAY